MFEKSILTFSKNFLIFTSLFIVLFPFLYLIVTSLRPQNEFLSNINIFPKSITFEHYYHVFEKQNALGYTFNSLAITGLVTIISIIFGSMAGYALARSKIKKEYVLSFIFVFIFIRFYPRIAVVVPWFLIIRDINLLDTIWAVIILHLGLTTPFVVWLMYTFYKGIPKELEESASIDGAGYITRFIKVALPLSLPGIATASIFTAFLSWNEFLLASSITRESAKTLPVSIAGFVTDKGVLWGPMMAMSSLIVIPMVIFSLALQKYLVKGIMLGAIKE